MATESVNLTCSVPGFFNKPWVSLCLLPLWAPEKTLFNFLIHSFIHLPAHSGATHDLTRCNICPGVQSPREDISWTLIWDYSQKLQQDEQANVTLKCFVLLTEEYETYIKKQEATVKTEVTTVVQEPKVGDIPPVVVTTMEQMTTIISGQVEALWAMTGGFLVMVWDEVGV